MQKARNFVLQGYIVRPRHQSRLPQVPVVIFAACGSFAGVVAAQPCQPAWSALPGGGTNGGVEALATFDGALYMGGDFTSVGGEAASRIARWDGQTWAALGAGTNDFVYSLAVFDDGGGPAVYAGGQFTAAGGMPASRIARWDGQGGWSPVGGGVNDSVFELAVFDDGAGPGLYPAGWLTSAGGVPASRIARWDGQSWSALGAGVGGSHFVSIINSLAVFDDGAGPALYAGGSFTTAGGMPANRVAKWNGQWWSPLSSGMDSNVMALAGFDDGGGPALYAAGFFTSAGGVVVYNIARWDGQSWSPLGSGVNNLVMALTVFDDGSAPALYAGGFFTSAGGVAANHIAKWDGQSWSALGAGIEGSVYSLAAFDDGSDPALYAGGYFTSAGGMPASNIARWRGCTPCYPNCDGSTAAPILNVDDFTCFINEFAAAHGLPHQQQIEHYANCDNSTIAPVLNVDDFTCFINAFAQGCR